MTRHSRYDGTDDGDTRFWRDMAIVFKHPDYADEPATDALADLYRRRRSN